jgi:hypothetical protein
MAKAKNDTEFYVKLENIRLPEDSVTRIEAGIQGLIMAELVGYKPDPDSPYPPRTWPPKGWKPNWPIVVRPPRPWPGLWAKKLLPKDIQALGIKDNVDIPVKI